MRQDQLSSWGIKKISNRGKHNKKQSIPKTNVQTKKKTTALMLFQRLTKISYRKRMPSWIGKKQIQKHFTYSTLFNRQHNKMLFFHRLNILRFSIFFHSKFDIIFSQFKFLSNLQSYKNYFQLFHRTRLNWTSDILSGSDMANHEDTENSIQRRRRSSSVTGSNGCVDFLKKPFTLPPNLSGLPQYRPSNSYNIQPMIGIIGKTNRMLFLSQAEYP